MPAADRSAFPRLGRVAVLWNATFKSMALGFKEIEVAAPTLGVTIQSLRAEGPQDFEAAFAAMRASGRAVSSCSSVPSPTVTFRVSWSSR